MIASTKNHAAHLSPFPPNLLPLQPVDGPDNQFGQITQQLASDPYKEIGIRGFQPFKPFKQAETNAVLNAGVNFTDINFPSLAELNNEMLLDGLISKEELELIESEDDSNHTQYEVFQSRLLLLSALFHLFQQSLKS